MTKTIKTETGLSCPKCLERLVKKKDHGEGVWFCESCRFSWFIVLSRQYGVKWK